LLDSFASQGALYPTSNLTGVTSIWTSKDNEVLPRNNFCNFGANVKELTKLRVKQKMSAGFTLHSNLLEAQSLTTVGFKNARLYIVRFDFMAPAIIFVEKLDIRQSTTLANAPHRIKSFLTTPGLNIFSYSTVHTSR
jgi:hypothetical protein